jgi:phosphoglycerol transferase MdoB-like AlkP superfamily enzyme
MIAYLCCRCAFLFFNPELVTGHSLKELLLVCIAGLRFDVFSILAVNLLLIVGHILPVGYFYNRGYQKVLKIIFYITNIPALLFNLVDCIYFRFTHKRTTADFFTSEMAADLKFNIFTYLKDFWYIPLILFCMIAIIELLYRKTQVKKQNDRIKPVSYTIGVLLTIGLTVTGIRGGFQYKPISMQTAARYTTQNLIPAVLNTPFSIIKTRGMEALPETSFMSDAEADKLYPVFQQFNYNAILKKNVVILIMESFSREYCGFFNNGSGYTPFLDSLCRHSLVFTNAYANSKRSIEGIPAILASMPHLMDESFISSAFNTNAINGIASLLNESGYKSYFYHGGNNGTMGFENFSALAGFNEYLGRNEYDGPASDYDGNWGIFDEPFFLFMKKKLDVSAQPFCSSFFSLSSHHPYTLPSNYQRKLKPDANPVFESIRYADHSLQSFFQSASRSSWFANTLFIITADHTGQSFKPSGMTGKGAFEIPLIFYCSSDSLLKGIDSSVVQHADILPSILDYLHCSTKFSAFGHSVFHKGYRSAVNYLNGVYQGIDDKNIVLIDGENGSLLGYYDYRNDPLLEHRIETGPTGGVKHLADVTRAALQQFRTHLMRNDLVKR